MQPLALLLFCGLISVSFGCRCAPLGIDKYYCNSDFAIEIQIKSDRHEIIDADGNVDQLNAWYDMEVIKVFHSSDQLIPAINSGKIWTGQNGAVCGRYFELNETYIITGYYDEKNNRLRTHTCTFGRLLSDMTDAEKEFFRTTYKSIDCSKLVK